jgi:hypothetical protein
MKIRILLAATLFLSWLLPAAVMGAPLAGPCLPGVAYDPACDVDHDGDVDIFDIQLAAGHWNQNGTWVSDNDHNHLGQTWSGDNNPLRLQGTFGTVNSNAPLILSNSQSTGAGLRVTSAGADGIYVGNTGNDGVSVAFPGDDGLYVLSSGDDGVFVNTAGGDGLAVGTAFGSGVNVEWATGDGLFVCRAGGVASCTPSASSHGLEVGNAQADGVRITDADDDGIQIGDGTNFPNNGLFVPSPGTPGDTLLPNTADASGQWALFTTDDIQAGNVFASGHILIAVVGGNEPLSPGDVVAATGLAAAIPDGQSNLAEVRLATPEQGNVAGVVHSRMVLRTLPGKAGEQDLRSVDGAAQAGDFVAITVLGATQVKLQRGVTVQPGQRLVVGAPGTVRPMQTRFVDGMLVTEGAPAVGAALQAAGEGMVWVLVNPS